MLKNVSLVVLNYDLDSIIFLVVGVGLDGSVALYDTVLNMCIVPDIHIVEDNGVLDVTVVADEGSLEYYGVLNGSVDDTSTGDKAVLNVDPHVILSRRKIYNLGVDSRILSEEVLSYLGLEEIHVGSVVVLNRCDVVPVILDLVSVDALHILVSYQDVPYEVVSLFLFSSLDKLDELSPSDYVDTAGNSVGS